MHNWDLWRKGRTLLSLTLLLMILMRLVWVQARHYPPSGQTQFILARALSPSGCLAPGDDQIRHEPAERQLVERHAGQGARRLWSRMSCRAGGFRPELAIRNNQYLLFGTVFAATLLTRIASGSWLLALITATVLLSRGRLIATIGDTSWEWLYSFFFTVWVTNIAHFLRTGAALSLFGIYVLAFALAILDPAFIGLSWALPLTFFMVPVLRRIFLLSPQRLLQVPLPPLYPVAAKPGLFRDLGRPFFMWADEDRRWQGLFAITFGLSLLVVTAASLIGGKGVHDLFYSLAIRFEPQRWRNWMISGWHLFDLDTSVALAALGVSACLSPFRGLRSFWELVWVSLVAVVLIGFGILVGDAIAPSARIWVSVAIEPFNASFRAGRFLVWLEPTVLPLGIVALMHLSKVLGSYFRGHLE